ncbi:hypothetical protein GCM10010124_30400 [Pilimelia terevasa]|uniref:Uncharacterized protein n=1 Tax=Pilimelia terevasa TaxID=53372 RepID=A0A8J3FKY2_9ACTN|nr:hypothetical protein [Pilimelia terevasa]GGK35597.1 hypothetical protein GCM10010124_30400 [Pilimelia terevasa]
MSSPGWQPPRLSGRRLAAAVAAAALGGAALVALTWFGSAEGLDRAEKWVSVCATPVSVAGTVAGVLLAVSQWRRSRTPTHEEAVRPPDGPPMPAPVPRADAGMSVSAQHFGSGDLNVAEEIRLERRGRDPR